MLIVNDDKGAQSTGVCNGCVDMSERARCSVLLCDVEAVMMLMTPMMMMLLFCRQQCRYASRPSELTTH
jgi:hypothetical protein